MRRFRLWLALRIKPKEYALVHRNVTPSQYAFMSSTGTNCTPVGTTTNVSTFDWILNGCFVVHPEEDEMGKKKARSKAKGKAAAKNKQENRQKAKGGKGAR